MSVVLMLAAAYALPTVPMPGVIHVPPPPEDPGFWVCDPYYPLAYDLPQYDACVPQFRYDIIWNDSPAGFAAVRRYLAGAIRPGTRAEIYHLWLGGPFPRQSSGRRPSHPGACHDPLLPAGAHLAQVPLDALAPADLQWLVSDFGHCLRIIHPFPAGG